MLLYGFFFLNDINTVQVEILCFAHPVVRPRRSLTIFRNTRVHYGKSRPLKNQSERARNPCRIIKQQQFHGS